MKCNFCFSNMVLLRFVDRDMILRYHWGHGVGHTYAYPEVSADVPEVPLSLPDIEEEEEESGQEAGLLGEDEDGEDQHSTGLDGMVYQTDSDDSDISDEDDTSPDSDADESEVCIKYSASVTKRINETL